MEGRTDGYRDHGTHLFTVVSWKDGKLTVKIGELSIDAAREVATTHASIGEASRTHCQECDYIETYCPHGSVRSGPFATTMLVATHLVNGTLKGYDTICCPKALRPDEIAV